MKSPDRDAADNLIAGMKKILQHDVEGLTLEREGAEILLSELATLRRRVAEMADIDIARYEGIVKAAIRWANANMLCGMAEASWEKGDLGDDEKSADAEIAGAREEVTDAETALFMLMCDSTGYPVKDTAALSPPTRKE